MMPNQTPEQHRATMKRWYEKSPENRKKSKDQGKRFRANNPNYDKDWRYNNPEKAMITRAKERAASKNLEISITAADIEIPDVCPVLGIPLFVNLEKKGPNSPSLDRFDNNLGYTPENIRVISQRANTLKRDANVKEIRSLADWMEKGG